MTSTPKKSIEGRPKPFTTWSEDLRAERDALTDFGKNDPPSPSPAPRQETTLAPRDIDSDDDDEMSLEFRGKPEQLAPLLTIARMTFLERPERYATDGPKNGFVAKQFRGPALEWLEPWITKNDLTTLPFEDFVDKLETVFAINNDTTHQINQSKLDKLRQTGSAAAFALAFGPLATKLKLSEETKISTFRAKLKPSVQNALAGCTYDDYSEIRDTAITADEQLYAARAPRKRTNRINTGANKT